MSWAWLGVPVLVAALFAVACYHPLRFDVSGRARGEADGSWVVAGGASLAVLAVTFLWARGLSPQLTFLLFGRKLAWQPRLRRRSRGAPPGRPEQTERPSARWLRRLDPLDLALKVLEERRHLRLRYLVIDLAYGFQDPVLTGRLVGALSALSAVLPSRIEVRQSPRWDFEDGWEVAVDSRAFVRPWLMLLDLSAYVVRRVASRDTPEASALERPDKSQVR